jgi:hypothetical protein
MLAKQEVTLRPMDGLDAAGGDEVDMSAGSSSMSIKPNQSSSGVDTGAGTSTAGGSKIQVQYKDVVVYKKKTHETRCLS